MMRPHLSTLALVSLCALAATSAPGCIDASQEPLDYQAVAVSRGGGVTQSGKWTITITRADVGLGPFYFCAAASGSSTLCESSIAEVANVTVVDALSPAKTPLGTVHGLSGSIQSASYDFGISWFDTQTAATPAPSLPSGHSMHLEGFARHDAVHVSFYADVDLVPQYAGQNAVSTAPAMAVVTTKATRLEVVLEPAAWFKQVDFDAMEASGRPLVAMTPGTPEHGAILVGIKNLAPLELRWVDSSSP